jgi:hypothetical protein
VRIFEQARPLGGRALIFLLTFVVSVVFWSSAGVATGACITGLGIVSAFFFSDQVTSGQESYGPAGVVIALITFLVGYGVCLHAGAVFGRMWNEREAERSAEPS